MTAPALYLVRATDDVRPDHDPQHAQRAARALIGAVLVSAPVCFAMYELAGVVIRQVW